MKKILGYYIDEVSEIIFVNYETYKIYIKNLIEEDEVSLNFEDKIRIFRNLLESILLLHTDGIVCLNISADSICINLSDSSIRFCNFSIYFF
jgi:hypothetical protein